MQLSDEWIHIFQSFTENTELIVKDIHPVFVWKSTTQKRVKLRAQLAPYNFATQVILVDGKYEFKLSTNHKKKFAELARDLRNMEGESMAEKWNNVLAGKPLKISEEEENQSNAEIETTLQHFPLPIQGEKRTFHNLNDKFKSNSSLIRIDGITKSIEKVLLKDGQGICLNDEGNICVLDPGEGIHVFNDNLTKISKIDFILPGSVGLTYHQEKFYVTVPLKNYIKIFHTQNISLSNIIQLPNPISIRVYCGSIYILSVNNLTLIHGNSSPVLLFEEKGSMVSFSDFIILDNNAFILDSFQGFIYKYELLTGKLNLTNIRDHQASGNPQCICLYENTQILISESDNNKISSFFLRDFGDWFNFITEYKLENFQPNKIVTKGKYIFTTALQEYSNIFADNQETENNS